MTRGKYMSSYHQKNGEPDVSERDYGAPERHPVSDEVVEDLKKDWEEGEINEIKYQEAKEQEVKDAMKRMKSIKMKHHLRVPTTDPYAYIESEFEGTAEQAVALYKHLTNLVKK